MAERGRPQRRKIKQKEPKRDTTLAHVRYLLGLSQTELAAKAGISQAAISYYENGLSITRDHAQQITKAFRQVCPPEYYSMIVEIHPNDLPRTWESMRDVLRRRMNQNDDAERADFFVPVVAGSR
jgi:transcriptional regulator with XRE-family HTH domain